MKINFGLSTATIALLVFLGLVIGLQATGGGILTSDSSPQVDPAAVYAQQQYRQQLAYDQQRLALQLANEEKRQAQQLDNERLRGQAVAALIRDGGGFVIVVLCACAMLLALSGSWALVAIGFAALRQRRDTEVRRWR